MKTFAALLLTLFMGAVHAEIRIGIESSASQPETTPEIHLLALNEGAEPMQVTFPASIDARLIADTRTWPIQLQASEGTTTELSPGAFLRRRYQFTPPPGLTGRLILEVETPFAARGVIELRDPTQAAEAAGVDEELAVNRIERAFLTRFALHEPIYFAYGSDTPALKYQFSFKYRLTGSGDSSGTRISSRHGLYFAYTQRSLWDIESESSPFFDTSYMPELFYEWLGSAKTSERYPWFHWAALQVGFRHESNGQAEAESRSLNMGYIRPAIVLGSLDGWNLAFVPRFKAYFDVAEENADIEDYRGNTDVFLVFGKNDGLKIGVTTDTGKGNVQVDVTHPVRIPLIGLETYLLLQYFDGYGESLRTYNERSSTWRLGISFAR